MKWLFLLFQVCRCEWTCEGLSVSESVRVWVPEWKCECQSESVRVRLSEWEWECRSESESVRVRVWVSEWECEYQSESESESVRVRVAEWEWESVNKMDRIDLFISLHYTQYMLSCNVSSLTLTRLTAPCQYLLSTRSCVRVKGAFNPMLRFVSLVEHWK